MSDKKEELPRRNTSEQSEAGAAARRAQMHAIDGGNKAGLRSADRKTHLRVVK